MRFVDQRDWRGMAEGGKPKTDEVIDHFDSLHYDATFLSSGDPGAIETANKAAALLQRGRTPVYSVRNWGRGTGIQFNSSYADRAQPRMKRLYSSTQHLL